MQILTQKDKNISIQKFKDLVEDRLGEVVWIEKEADFSEVPWDLYDGEHKGVSKPWLHRQLEIANEYYKYTIDMYFCFIKVKNWQGGSVQGWHLGREYKGARICQVKNRRNWIDTAEHELVHAVWAYVHMHTGIKLEDVLGVTENGVAHGDAEGWEEYEYDRFWELVRPYYQQARGEDMSDEYRGLAKTAIRLAQKLIRQLKR